MKFFQCIVLSILCLVSSLLHAQYPEFNVGEEIGAEYILSPNGKFLTQTNYNSRTLKLWNTQTGQLHSKFNASYGQLFFSSDSTMLFIIENQVKKEVLHQYEITQEGVVSLSAIDSNKFTSSNTRSYACVINEEKTEFKKLKTENTNQHTLDIFLSTLHPDGTEKTLQLNSQVFSLGYTTCVISPDAKSMAVYCQKFPSNPRYIHVIDLESFKITHNYRISNRNNVATISFSPDRTKLILPGRFTIDAINYAEYWFEIIDLNTNQLSKFSQEKLIQYAAFIDNTTVLIILKDGSVSYHEITSENLEQHRVNNNSHFRALTDDPFDW